MRGQTGGVKGGQVDVLVVDDDKTVRDLLVMIVESDLGLRVEEAVDGAAALEAIAKTQPRLLLTDLYMPNLDGAALVRRLRDAPATRKLAIIVVTSSLDARGEALRAGADDYLEKPFDVDVLLGKVHRQLDKRQQQRSRPQAA